jgi:hypothetical protein
MPGEQTCQDGQWSIEFRVPGPVPTELTEGQTSPVDSASTSRVTAPLDV